MGMGIARLVSQEWEWERLDWNGRELKLHIFLDVHETLLALTMRVHACILKIYNRTVSCIVEFTGHLLSDRYTNSSTGMGARGNGNN